MKHTLVIQHSPHEGLGIIADVLTSQGMPARHIRPYEGDKVPRELGDDLGLVVMGGPMGVYDHPRYPFLGDEMRLIEHSLKQEKPVLGICLGSQLLAATLGAEVNKARKKEIGWHAVSLQEAALTDSLWKGIQLSFKAYHWHGDAFTVPFETVSLATSELTSCQAFRFGGSAYGILFHMEVTEDIIRSMVKEFSGELEEVGLNGEEIITKGEENLPRLQKVGHTVFGRWASLLHV